MSEDRVPTGVEGFDALIDGGFPRGSLVLLAGRAGSGKTIFSAQYLYHGASKLDEPGMYVSFAENRETFLTNMSKLNMDFEKLDQEGKFRFLDYATITEKAVTETLTNVLGEMDRLKAKRLVIDPFTALAQAFKGPIEARIAIHTILGKMVRQAGCTTLLITEKTSGVRQMGLGIEEFVADGVVLLDTSTRRGRLTRKLQIIKMRGTKANSGDVNYDITKHGIRIRQFPETKQAKRIYDKTLGTGIKGLDEMFGGGLPQASTTMVTGPSGSGKTAIALHFAVEGAQKDERSLFLSFEEPEAKVIHYAEAFGWDIRGLMSRDLMRIKHIGLKPDNVDEQLLQIQELMREYQPVRCAIDSLTPIKRTMGEDDSVQYMRRWNSSLTADGITVMFTTLGETARPVTDMEISTCADNVISLRDDEVGSTLKRSLAIFKARGISHDRNIREFDITPKGVMILPASTRHIMRSTGRRPFTQDETHVALEHDKTR